MTKKEFQVLLDKYLSGLANQHEEKQLFDWYAEFEGKDIHPDEIPTQQEQEHLFADLESHLGYTEYNKTSKLSYIRIAASVFVAAILAGMVYHLLNKQDTIGTRMQQQSIATAKGQRSKFTLADGTLVWLNADSKLSFPKTFATGKREVALTGEAYFEVKHDTKHPFIVHTHELDVQVLGTVFDVKAYPKDKTAETSLIKGLVKITLKDHKAMLLHPNQKLILTKQHNEVSNKPTHMALYALHANPQAVAAAETGWKEGYLSFEDERFEDLAIELERWFNIKVSFENTKLKDYRFTGTLNDADLHTVMEALMLSRHFNYREEANRTIIIY